MPALASALEAADALRAAALLTPGLVDALTEMAAGDARIPVKALLRAADRAAGGDTDAFRDALARDL